MPVRKTRKTRKSKARKARGKTHKGGKYWWPSSDKEKIANIAEDIKDMAEWATKKGEKYTTSLNYKQNQAIMYKELGNLLHELDIDTLNTTNEKLYFDPHSLYNTIKKQMGEIITHNIRAESKDMGVVSHDINKHQDKFIQLIKELKSINDKNKKDTFISISNVSTTVSKNNLPLTVNQMLQMRQTNMKTPLLNQ